MRRGVFIKTIDRYQNLGLPNSDFKLIFRSFKEAKTVIRRDPFLVLNLFLKDSTIRNSTLAINRGILNCILQKHHKTLFFYIFLTCLLKSLFIHQDSSQIPRFPKNLPRSSEVELFSSSTSPL